MRTINAQANSQSGMTLLAVMGIMVLLAVALLAVAPGVQVEVQREKELEAIRRGEEISDAIERYLIYYRGAKLPTSIDDLLEGLPQGTKKVQILRPSAAVDPLSPDGKWRLIQPEPKIISAFAKRVQDYNGGLLPSNRSQVLDRYSVIIVNSLNTADKTDATEPEDDSELTSESGPFIGVASKSKAKSVISYYGIENHSKWIFTPLFRGSGASRINLGAANSPPGISDQNPARAPSNANSDPR